MGAFEVLADPLYVTKNNRICLELFNIIDVLVDRNIESMPSENVEILKPLIVDNCNRDVRALARLERCDGGFEAPSARGRPSRKYTIAVPLKTVSFGVLMRTELVSKCGCKSEGGQYGGPCKFSRGACRTSRFNHKITASE